MPRAVWIPATIAILIGVANGSSAARGGAGSTNEPCGFVDYPPCEVVNNSCELLSPEVLASVVGPGWTRQGAGPMRPLPGAPVINHCQYNGPGEDDDAILAVRPGGRAQFNTDIQNNRDGLRPLSGVGDAAYEFVFPGDPSPGVELWVIERGVYFDVRLDSGNPNFVQWGVALARKVADRIK
jgi:hypothetical protein